jgi:hypothetical protein
MVLTTTRRLQNPRARVVRDERIKFAKGSMHCFVHRILAKKPSEEEGGGKKKKNKRSKVQTEED